jgi:hypothetical protein
MGSVVKAIFSPVKALAGAVGLGGDKPRAQPLPSFVTAGGDIMKNRPQDVETRANQLKQQATAAGAERTDNEADLLGNVRPAKKRSAAQSLLG